MNKLSTPLVVSVVALAISTAVAQPIQAEITANVAVANDYRFRGISQNDKAFAISGGFDYANEGGFYAGIWASSVDFQIVAVDDASTELDLYFGYGGELGDSGLAYDINLLHFNYPNSDSGLGYNFTELTVGLSYADFSFSVSNTSDYFANSGSAQYYSLGYEYALNDDFTLSASLGKQDVEDNGAWGTPNWMDYKIAVSTSFSAIDAEFAFIDTDLSEAECFGGSDWCDATFVITLSKSL